MRITLYRTLSLRYLQQRWSRATLVALSIALGVATMVATQALNRSMSAAARTSARPMAGLADLHVGNGDAGVSKDLVPVLARVPGVHEVLPLVVERVMLPDLDNRAALLVGVEVKPGQMGDNPWGIHYQVTNPLAALTQGRRAVFAGAELAGELNRVLPAGANTFRVLAAGEVRNVPRWVGTVDAHGPAAALGGQVLYLDAAAAGELLGRPQLYTRIDLKLTPDADVEAVRRAVDEVLQGKAKASTPEAQDQSIHEAMTGLQIGFSMCGAGALVIGLFLVYNALAVSVTERRHEIGILRSVGATRGQIWALFVGEAGLLGLAGAAVGVPLGIGLARVGLAPMAQVFNDLFMTGDAQQLVLTGGIIAASVLAGVGTAVLAALVPAVRASHEEPANAVRRVPPPTGLRHQYLQLALSATFVVAGLTCMVFREALPKRAGTHGCLVLVLLGLLLLMPLVAAVLARLLQPLARRLFRIESRLAADNLVRAPGRTGLVITALAAGVAMVLQTAGVIASNEHVVLGWVERSIKADLFVRSGNLVSGGATVPMREELGRQMAAADPGIAAVLPARFRPVDFRGKKVFLIALDARGFHEASRSRGSVPRQERYPLLAEPGVPAVLVSDNFAALYGVGEGDTIQVQGPHGPVELRVVGVVEDYSWNLGTLIMDRGHYKRHFDDTLVDVFDVFLRPDADRDAIRETLLRRWGSADALVVLTREELREWIRGIIRRLYDIAYAQEIVAGVVAALGVVTALLIAVMQRRSELGILRAIGATQGQVLASVLAEATLMGLIGTVIGMLVGVPLEWYILHVILFEEAGFQFAVYVPWLEAGVIACLALAIATLAGLWPALHTMRLRIPEAIAYE